MACQRKHDEHIEFFFETRGETQITLWVDVFGVGPGILHKLGR